MNLEHKRRFQDVPLADADLRRHIWTQLQRAAFDKFHEWRTPVLATVDAQGLPQARTVVLRHVDVAAMRVCIYTDSRSPKAAELTAQPQACLVFWSKRLNWQLRVLARAEVLTSGTKVDAAWAELAQSPAAADYLSVTAPGSPLMNPSAAPLNPHLAVLSFDVLTIDWLELARSGHRRARITADALTWLVP